MLSFKQIMKVKRKHGVGAHVVEISISGPAMSGKTTLMDLIATTLRQHGLNVECFDEDPRVRIPKRSFFDLEDSSTVIAIDVQPTA